MKKSIYIFFSASLLLSACHPTIKSGSDNGSTTVVDTSKMKAIQQAPDTSVKADGRVIKRYPNGIIKENGYYVAGRRQGECQSFYQDGKLESDCYFKDGLSDGSCITYYENGQKRYEGTFTKGKPSGAWNFYDATGKIVRIKNYGKLENTPVM